MFKRISAVILVIFLGAGIPVLGQNTYRGNREDTAQDAGDKLDVLVKASEFQGLAPVNIPTAPLRVKDKFSLSLVTGIGHATALRGNDQWNISGEFAWRPYDMNAIPWEFVANAGYAGTNPSAEIGGIPSQVLSDNSIVLTIGARYYWHYGKVQLYSGAAFGGICRWQTSPRGSRSTAHWAGNVTAFGIRTSGKVFLLAEAGYGSLGLVRLGLGIKL